MVSITLSVPEEVRQKMKEFPEVNWSGLVRQCITEKANKLVLKQKLIKQLEEEKGFDEWAVRLIRRGRNENSSRHKHSI
jgi:hypothetical protein